MANFITNGINNLFNMIAMGIADNISQRINAASKEIDTAVNYRVGRQPKQLLVKPGQHDDNMTVNLSGLIVDKSVSAVLGDGIEIDLPGDENSPEQQYINDVMKLNRSKMFLHNAVMTAADGGTGFIKIMPDMIESKGKLYPRLDVINPAFVTMFTLPHDNTMVNKYVIQYKFYDLKNEEALRREVTEQDPETELWTVTTYELSYSTSGKWEQIGEPITWEYDFPPIVHWQNLPNPYGAMGEPDLTEDVRVVQDKYNEVSSNNAKIIRIFTHPMRYTKGLSGINKIEVGPNDMPSLPSDSSIEQLPALGDLAGSLSYLQLTKRNLFAITRTVDIESLEDKIGSLTNFGLKVIYQDMISKVETKRELFGEALLELVKRVLILAGFAADEPGKIIWSDILPVNDKEKRDGLKTEIEMEVVSKETAAKELGRIYKTDDGKGEFDKIQAEKELENAQRNTLGNFLVNNFEAR